MAKFERFRAKMKFVLDINENQLLNSIISQPEIKELIIALNTRKQLFDKGINSLGVSLESIGGPYSPATIEGVPGVFEGKRDKGLPFDRITLFNEGNFYKTWTVSIPTGRFADFFNINANPIKDGTNLFDDWSPEIVGLTQESLEVLRNKIRPFLQQIIRQGFAKAA